MGELNYKNMANNKIAKNLFRTKEDDYNNQYKEHLLSQYKMYVRLLEQSTGKRQKSNHLFLTIHTALLAILGFVNKEVDGDLFLINILIALSGMVICYSWYRLIKSYKNVNAAKFKIVHVIEEKLPLSLYSAEWNLLGKGENSKLYKPITSIELIIPIIFTIIYLVLILVNIFYL